MFQRGFTVIELVVVIAIMGILTVVASQFLVGVIQGNNRATIENEVRQNAETIRGDVVSEIRRSACVSTACGGPALCLSDVNDGSANCGTGSRRVSYTVSSTAPLGVVTKTVIDISAGTSAITMTSPATALCSGTACPLTTCTGGLVVSSNGSGSFGIAVNATQSVASGSRSDFCANISLQDTATPRQY